MNKFAALTMAILVGFATALLAGEPTRPNIVLVMADDQGWGQTGYYRHPVLKTPNLDAMAAGGLRLDRFYAGAPVCSPTRASVLTGRSNMRTGVDSHGYALRGQEKTMATVLCDVGYATGHFGKWHLNGMRGPGVPILATDTHNPGTFGFDEWLSVTNFFDRDPILSRNGKFTEFKGDSSEIIVHEALKFIGRQSAVGKPSLTVIWYGTPHNPFRASDEDKEAFVALDVNSQEHYGELVAMDRSIGTLRAGLRDLNIANNTLVWFCSDNGGLPKITPETVGGLRGFKGSLYEGGLRVPAIIEWPERITEPRVTQFPAVTMDIFPTIAQIVGLPDKVVLQPQDGISLRKLFTEELPPRAKPIPFSCFGNTALVDNNHKLIRFGRKKGNTQYELYDLAVDPMEKRNLFVEQPKVAQRLQSYMMQWDESVRASVAGKDYPEGKLNPGDPEPRFWMDVDAYRPYFSEWKKRPEYKSRLTPRRRR